MNEPPEAPAPYHHVSLKQVASQAGVSFQTASKVLNGKGTVSAPTRERILAAARSLQYVPNGLARSLISRTTTTIGVIATDFSDTTLAQHIVGMEREARRQGHCVIIGSLDRRGSDAEEYLRALLERRVDGIIMNAPVTEGSARVGEILRGSVPVVSLHPIHGGGISLVTADDALTGLLPVRHLIAMGHRRIAMITGTREREIRRIRSRAYRQALAEAKISFDTALVEEGRWEIEGGHQATHRLLDRAPDLTSIFAQNDMMAIGALSALHERGRRVPEDCAVVGCDDLPIASRTIPPLTTVHIPFYEVGVAAMRLLIEQVGATVREPKQVTLPVRMVYRASAPDRTPLAAQSGSPRDGDDVR